MNEPRSIGGMTLAGKTEVLGEKHAPVELFSPKIPHRLSGD
jgi:hypothetical protein